jgi:hypothetical protein
MHQFLSKQYIPGAVSWADDQYDGAWSNALHRFEDAIIRAETFGDESIMDAELDIFQGTILALIRCYQTHLANHNIARMLAEISA